MVALAFLRVVTHPGFPNGPTPPIEAAAVIDSLRARRRCRWLLPGPRHWEIARRLCLETGAAGKSVADAQHAAVAIEHGCSWLTRDADFTVFQPLGLRLDLVSP